MNFQTHWHRVFGDTLCDLGSNASVYVFGTKKGQTYSFYLENEFLGDTMTWVDGYVQFVIPANKLNPESNSVKIKVAVPGCGAVMLHQAIVLVNPVPDFLYPTITSYVCGDTASAHISFAMPHVNTSYQLEFNDKSSIPIFGVPSEFITFSIPGSDLGYGKNVGYIVSNLYRPGCGVFIQKTEVDIFKSPSAVPSWHAIGDTALSSQPFAHILLLEQSPNVTFEAYENGLLLGSAQSQAGKDTVLLLLPIGDSIAKLRIGLHHIQIRTTVASCSAITYTFSVDVLVHSAIISTLPQESSMSNVRLWPNPTSSSFHVQTASSFGPTRIRISNSIGLQLYEHHFQEVDDVEIHPELSRGMYHVSIEGQGGNKQVKLVVQ